LEIKATKKKSHLISRKITFEEANGFAKKHQLKYFETSAKESTNVDEVFSFIAETILEDIRTGKVNPKNEVD